MNAQTESGQFDITAVLRHHDYQLWSEISYRYDYDGFSLTFPPLTSSAGLTRLGSSMREVCYRMHDPQGVAHRLQAWFVESELVMLELMYPGPRLDAAELVEKLGKPLERLDYHLDIGQVVGGAYVFSQQGVTLFLDDAHRRVQKVALYRPCSLDHYKSELYFDAEMRELP